MISLFVIFILSYLAGSIPTSIIVSKLFYKKDIREHGSGNAGGTNVFRVLGWKPGVFVALVDVGKGVLATLIISQIKIDTIPAFFKPDVLKLCAGIFAIIGHIWTVFAGFRGGKGVGTAAGVILSLYPIAILICFAIWGTLVLTTRIVSVSSMTAAICLPITLFVMDRYFDIFVHPLLFGISIVLALLIVFTHRSNLKRLFRGEENRFKPIWQRNKK
ncbi:glycerol-3-phosphate 1-O-acyltransferase PlsY [candidate division KSB1 bacterium]|nr:glycerol-3-phosphate 1-O-acyltransferase PlsY [candidate division KSB1 bacterium]